MSRTQRRRRSKSPILHPPKFTYCSSSSASTLSASGLTQQRPTANGGASSSVSPPAQNELCTLGTAGHSSPLVFGSQAAYETLVGASSHDTATAVVTSPRQSRDDDPSACVGAEPEAGAPRRTGNAMDFRALSELHGPRPPCCCVQTNGSASQGETRCQCRGVEVYSFTGLRDVISECERSPQSNDDTLRTQGTNTLSSGSPRSCSEQARAYVDDVTIEDLSGYMEFYLYIPKKMSHMAEMMYT